MAYHSDARSISLAQLRERLESTDLIPSQQPLLDGIGGKIAALGRSGVNSVDDLLAGLKTAKSRSSLADSTGIDADYLALLRRVVTGFFPKPRPLKDIDWLDAEAIAKLSEVGVTNTRQLHETVSAGAGDLAERSGVAPEVIAQFMEVADLCRIQWVSPTFARVLADAGYTNAEKVAQADPEALYEAITKANEGARFYKGKIGLRDIRRLVAAASYVP